MQYKFIVTSGRTKMYTTVARLTAALMVFSLVIFVDTGVRYEIMLVVDVIWSVFWFICVSLIAYFYVKTYLAVRKWNRSRIRPVNVLAQRKLETKVAFTTFWSTVFVGVSGAPILVVYFLQGALPFSAKFPSFECQKQYFS